MRKGVLIMGSSPAALQAALDLADANVDVHLASGEPFLEKAGTASPAPAPEALPQLQVLRHPGITLWSGTRIDTIENENGRYAAVLKTAPRYVDIAKCTGCRDCIDVCPVETGPDSERAIRLPHGAQPGCAVIRKEGRAPCAAACPGGIHVQGYVALAAKGRYQEAIDLIRDAIPFPGIMGRICMHPCEIQCRRNDLDGPVSIRRLKRFLADWDEAHGTGAAPPVPHQPPAWDAKRIAVVGAGPAGMTAADTLARWGYRVTVFDKLPVKGGMLAVGIPAYRLPRDIIAREYERIEALGVEVRLNTAIGPDGDYTVADLLKDGFDAVCLAVGAHKSLSLNIDGESLPGVVHGIHLLQTVSLSQQLNHQEDRKRIRQWLRKGKETTAVVIGGGNTAMDVARTVKRLGAGEVTIIYRRTKEEMPALPEEIHETESEGIPITYLTAPVAVLGDAANGASGIRCIRMKLAEPDESGRRRPVPINGSEYEITADLVIPAIGQAADGACVASTDGIQVTRYQRIDVVRDTLATGRKGVFAAGDAVTTRNMSAIEAIGMGKQAAASIHQYLQGDAVAPQPPVSMPIARPLIDTAHHPSQPPLPAPMCAQAERMAGFSEVEKAYDTRMALGEAGRCLACGPCSECLACEKACEAGAIVHDQPPSSDRVMVDAVIHWNKSDHIPQGSDIPLIPYDTPNAVFSGTVAAGRYLSLMKIKFPEPVSATATPWDTERPRTGVFICQCGGHISQRLDTARLTRNALQGPHVVHAEERPFSCTPYGITHMEDMVIQHRLNRMVLAACTCCALDQTCHSCTLQRIRCKKGLGLFGADNAGAGATPILRQLNLPAHAFDFVNIREHCAYGNETAPETGMVKAEALITAAVTRLALPRDKAVKPDPIHPTITLLGSGATAAECRTILGNQPMDLLQLTSLPDRIESVPGGFRIQTNGTAHAARTLVLAPDSDREWREMQERFPFIPPQQRKGTTAASRGAISRGLFICPTNGDPKETAMAVAAMVTAWMGRSMSPPRQERPQVDPYRCRSCGTCEEICESGAPQWITNEGLRASWIDPIRCIGCGACAAQCPSGAISFPDLSDHQLEATLDAILCPERGVS